MSSKNFRGQNDDANAKAGNRCSLSLCICVTIGAMFNFNIDGNATVTCERTLNISNAFKHAVTVHIQFSTYVINLVYQIWPNKDVSGSQLNDKDAQKNLKFTVTVFRSHCSFPTRDLFQFLSRMYIVHAGPSTQKRHHLQMESYGLFTSFFARVLYYHRYCLALCQWKQCE